MLFSTFAVLLPHIFQYACDSVVFDENIKYLMRDVLVKLIYDYPKLYRNFLAKYDPQNKYAAKLENVLYVKREFNIPNVSTYSHSDFDEYDESYGT